MKFSRMMKKNGNSGKMNIERYMKLNGAKITKFIESDIYHKFMDNPFNPNHELAHKKVIDYFFPEDKAEITIDVNDGCPLASNNWLRTHNIDETEKDMLPVLDKIYLAGYVQEIIDLGFEDYLENILTCQIVNVLYMCHVLTAMDQADSLYSECYINDDGKFAYHHKRFHDCDSDIVKEYIAAGKWCLNFLKNN